ncbi:DsrE family protein [Qipengyuania sp. JC766]|uniref:DsrE family protein n=1 Tax=Qipengyuania sp. JC766 TaxID=3232139 RepID=UPI00345A2066
MRLLLLLATMALTTPAMAQDPDASRFEYGPVFAEYGATAEIASTVTIPADTQFKVAFDAARQASGQRSNTTFNSAARLINMHARAGHPVAQTQAAIVVHGGATMDVLNATAYAARFDGAENPSAGLVRALLDHGVRIIVCGQSAVGQGVDETSDLMEGVKVATSAMTAHALLQQDGYTVNPF